MVNPLEFSTAFRPAVLAGHQASIDACLGRVGVLRRMGQPLPTAAVEMSDLGGALLELYPISHSSTRILPATPT